MPAGESEWRRILVAGDRVAAAGLVDGLPALLAAATPRTVHPRGLGQAVAVLVDDLGGRGSSRLPRVA